MSLPTRCISSHLTSLVLEIRNPQGTNIFDWQGQDGHNLENRGDLLIFSGRVVVTELSCALLMVSSAVESVAYTILIIASLTLYLYSDVPLERSVLLLESSLFTTYWNFGNILVFNPFCINIATHESTARFTIRNWPRGAVLETIFYIAILIYTIATRDTSLARVTRRESRPTRFFATRPEDRLYLGIALDQSTANRLGANPAPEAILQAMENQQQARNPVVARAAQAALPQAQRIQLGVQFMRAYMLNPAKVDEDTVQAIKDWDAEVFAFVLTRMAYIYVLGEKQNNGTPQFLKDETKTAINTLRIYFQTNQPSADELNALEKPLRNHMTFNDTDNPILNRLKTVNCEHQNSLFLTYCWQRATQEG